jgi:two-component system, sensor histidine kinase
MPRPPGREMPSDPLLLDVDDTRANRYWRMRVLRQAGFTLIEAATGEEAIRLAAERLPRLVLLDVNLPDMNGLEVCRRLKAFEHPPFVLLTSALSVDTESRIAGLEAGADAYLLMPADPLELLAQVRALLRIDAAERQSREREERLQEAIRQKEHALHVISHELRQPLNGLAVAASILSREDAPAKARTRAAGAIARQVRNLTRLADDLLEAARLARGAIALQREPVDVRHVIADAVVNCRPTGRRAGVTLTHDLPSEPLVVSGDSTRLAQVVQNLLSNALKFTRSDGHITVSAQREVESIFIAVADDGAGIDPALLPRVFDLFVRGESETGLGIGLALARQLVELHGGTIEAESGGLGRGARFTVRLPTEVPAGSAL